MAVVIRLQGLRITAGSEDIRGFFKGLRIPDGGVHIVGGEKEEAFIVFASDEDARRAMTRSGGFIKGSSVNLMLSSRTEMQNVLEARVKKSEASKRRTCKEEPRRLEPLMRSAPLNFSPNLCVEIHQGDHVGMGGGSFQAGASTPRDYRTRKTLSAGADGLYLYMQGLPFSVTKDDVRNFFHELQVDDVILMKNAKGQNNGSGLVKFMSLHDANEGLMRDRGYIGSRFVEINPSTERQWIRAGGHTGPCVGSTDEFGRKGFPVNMEKRYDRNRTRSRSPVACRPRSASPCNEEYCVIVQNLSYAVEKSDLKQFFESVDLKDDQIIHLFDKKGNRSRACFVVFKNLRDYCAALAHHMDILVNRRVSVTPVSKDKISDMLHALNMSMVEHGERSSVSPKNTPRYQVDPELQKTCLYVRNLPFDVRKVEIVDFFQGYGISEDSVFLLLDEKGVGLGEALVTFQSEEDALRAVSLNGQRFLGSEVMLKCIARGQMKEFGIFESSMGLPGAPPQRRSPEIRGSQRGVTSHFARGEYSGFGGPSDDRVSMNNVPDLSYRSRSGSRRDFQPEGRGASRDRGVEAPHKSFDLPGQPFDGPTCLKLENLPPRITIEEIYDFCYGFSLIPGSVSLQCDRDGIPKGTATVVFQTRQEALTAIQELNGRPIGARRITLLFI